MTRKIAALALSLAAWQGAAQAGTIADARAERAAPDTVVVTWSDKDPVDVYLADRPDAGVAQSRLVSANDRDGSHRLTVAPGARPYILLRDRAGGGQVRVAERVVPLQQGSNFRDLGGYPAAGGRHVRWGVLYRSGATALLTDADVQRVQALALKDVVDLRSSEERVMAPTRLNGVRYSAVGYSLMNLIQSPDGKAPPARPLDLAYREFPARQAPQLRVLFSRLLAKEGPIAYNCSAGQDRTGFATAMVLSALGAPREVIYADYHLSTTYRQPQFEMPKIDTVAQADDPVAMFFARFQKGPEGVKPKPLYDAAGEPYLAIAFKAIEDRWGPVEAYLQQEAGVGPAEIQALRAAYLE